MFYLRLKYRFTPFLILITLITFGENKEQLLMRLKQANSDSAKAMAYFNLGDYYVFSNPELSTAYFDSAINVIGEAVSKEEKNMLSKIYHYKGAVFSMQGKYSEAMDFYKKSLDISEKLFEKFPYDSSFVYRIINNKINLALIEYEQGHYANTLKSFDEILSSYNDCLSEKYLGRIYNNMGITYFQTGQNDSALIYYKKALKIYKKHGMQRKISMAYLNLGSAYSNLENYEKAEEYLLKALELKNRLKDYHGKAICLLSLAEVEYAKKDYKKSLKLALQAQILSKEKNFLKQERDAYELAAKNYEKLKEYKKALEYQKEFKNLNDSIFNAESRDKIAELRTQYETREKEAQILFLKQKEKNQQFVKKLLIAGIVLIVLISFLIIRAIILKRRNEKRIFDIRKQLDEKEKNLIRSELEKKELETKELNREIEFKSKQLTTHALNIMQKNKLLQNLITEIDNISKHAKPEVKSELKKVKRLVKLNSKTDKEWDLFKLYFEQINKGFFEKLIAINPSLNIYDLRHCALIKLNMNIKETASVLNLSPNSVKSARYRLKKKLGLSPDDDLYEFLRGL